MGCIGPNPRAVQAIDEMAMTKLMDQIDDAAFRAAIAYLDAGDVDSLRAHLTAHPRLARQRLDLKGEAYFRTPALLEFVAENPVRNGMLPPNIVALTEVILEAGAKADVTAVSGALALVSSGRVAREAGVQRALIALLCRYGADPSGAMLPALAHGEFDAARALLQAGAVLDLPSAAALNLAADVEHLLPASTPDGLQLALSLAALHGHAGVVTQLLEAGAEPNRHNPPGAHAHCTPLHSAAFAGHLATVKALTRGGARCGMLDAHHGATALDWAEHAGHIDVAEFLRAST